MIEIDLLVSIFKIGGKATTKMKQDTQDNSLHLPNINKKKQIILISN